MLMYPRGQGDGLQNRYRQFDSDHELMHAYRNGYNGAVLKTVVPDSPGMGVRIAPCARGWVAPR